MNAGRLREIRGQTIISLPKHEVIPNITMWGKWDWLGTVQFKEYMVPPFGLNKDILGVIW